METLRKSSYLIPIKLDNSNQYMLIHGYTGAIDIVDDNLKNYLQSDTIITDNSFPYSNETLKLLKERGYLTTKSKEEEYAYVKKVANILHKRNKMSVKSFTLLVTYDCNFRCSYCYEKEVLNKVSEKSHITISKDMVDNFYSKIAEIEPIEKLRNKTINLFGGEPLLKDNREIIDYILQKGQKSGYAFTATTNGYDLNYYEDYLNKDCIKGIQITIDGTQSMHDSRRIHFSDHKSFNRIINNVKMALNKGITVNVRINIDNNNIDELVKLDNHFNEIGLYSFENLNVYAAFISGDVNFIPSKEIESTSSMKKQITQRDFLHIFKNNKLHIKHDIALLLNLQNAITKGKAMRLTPCYCNAQDSSYAFDPFGYIYSCLEVVGNKEKSIGVYNKDLVWNNTKDVWFNRNSGNINRCNKCKYALICGGGCFTKTFSSEQPIDSYCDDFSIIIRNVANEVYAQLKKEQD